ncbi:hypothetical protein ACTHT3_17100, partial [Neisseria sp. P0015.S004]
GFFLCFKLGRLRSLSAFIIYWLLWDNILSQIWVFAGVLQTVVRFFLLVVGLGFFGGVINFVFLGVFLG